MTQRTWYLDPIRGFLSLIDGVIYDFINKLYQLFAYISQMTLFDDQIFKNFASRIYMILGIVMLFKVAFSLISYLVNPDELTDSKTGIGNVVKRIIISLVLLTFVPTIFTYAFRIQSIIVGDNILGNLILGDAGYNNDPDNANIQTTSSANNTDNSTSLVDNGGKLMAFDVLTAFYYIEPTVVNHNGYCKSEDSANEATDECDYGGDNAFDEDGSEHFNEIFNVPDSPYYHNVKAYLKYANRQVGSDGDVDKKGYYGMHYSVILSTIAGGFTLALLLTFCFDVALRAVKLAVLQLIAPIPILSYIEPKKGEGIMQKWIQESISTYVSLFIRLAILFFIIYFGSLISKNGIKILDSEGNPQNIEEAGYVYSMLAKAFIWMGLLMFAKEAPKLIGDLFGIKSDGFSINPMQKFRQVPLLSAGGAWLGTRLAGGITSATNDQTGHKARSFFSGWGAAGEAAKNKIDWFGNGDGKNQHLIRAGMQEGFKDATGSEMPRTSFTRMFFRKNASTNVKQLKEERKNPLKLASNKIEREMDAKRNDLMAIANQLQVENAKPNKNQNIINQLQAKRTQTQAELAELSRIKITIDKDSGIIDDQMSDINKKYYLDESSKEKLEKIEDKFSQVNIADFNNITDAELVEIIQQYNSNYGIPTNQTNQNPNNVVQNNQVVNNQAANNQGQNIP